PLIGVIEDDQGVEAGKERDREAVRVGRAIGETLEEPDQVVAEVADQAAGERDGTGLGRDLGEQRAQGGERRAGEAAGGAAAAGGGGAAGRGAGRGGRGALLLEAVRVETVDGARGGAQEAEAGDALATADALEQEAAVRELRETAVDRERSEAVGQELPD